MNRIATRTIARNVGAKASTRAYAVPPVPPAPGVQAGSNTHAAQQVGNEALKAKVAGQTTMNAAGNSAAARGMPPPSSQRPFMWIGIGLLAAGGIYYYYQDPEDARRANARMHEAEGKAKGYANEAEGKARSLANEAEGKAKSLANQAEGKFDELAGKAKGKWEETKGEAKKAMK